METFKDYEFKGRVKLPLDQSTPANQDIWFDSVEGKLAFRLGGVDILVPLASELGGGGGLTQEEVEDFIAVMINDNSFLDWSYTDNAGSPGILVATIKPGIITNTELADMAAATIKGRALGAGSGDPTDLTAAQVRAILDFTNEVRSSISISDTASLDLAYSSGVFSGTVLDSPLLEGNSFAQVVAAAVAAISNGAAAAYDTLIEIQGLLEDNDDAVAALTSAIALRPRFFAGVVPNGAPTANVDHNLNLTNIHDFIVRVVVSATGAEEEYEAVGSTADRLILTDETGSNIASGRRILVIAGV